MPCWVNRVRKPFVIGQFHLNGADQDLCAHKHRNVITIIGDPHIQIFLVLEQTPFLNYW